MKRVPTHRVLDTPWKKKDMAQALWVVAFISCVRWTVDGIWWSPKWAGQHSAHACTLARVAREAPRHRRCTSALATPTAPTARRAPSPRTAPSSLTSSCAGSEHTPAAAASTPRRRPIAPLPPAVRRSRSGHRSHARSPRLRRGAWPAGLLSHVPGHR